jgi:uncharacterized membrane-anchored protein
MRFLTAAMLGLCLLASPLAAQQPTPAAPAESVEARKEREFKEAVDALDKAAKPGPATIPLLEQGEIQVPAGYLFVPSAETAKLMRAMGNRTGGNLVGLLLSPKDGLKWFALLTYNKSGYVKDDDAKEWKADELLSQIKEGTENGNADRISRGFNPIEVVGWVAPPAYDTTSHQLIWSALIRQKAAPKEQPASVNYNTYALGREGFFELNLISSDKTIDEDKRHAPVLLSALKYKDGKRYEDFNPATDRAAEFGLAALIAGAAAKKLGVFALALAFLAKSWKIAAIAIFGFGGLIGKLFKRKS